MDIKKEWQVQIVDILRNGYDFSIRDLAQLVNIPKSTVGDFVKKYREFKNGVAAKTTLVEHENQRILFISDMHIPYHHPNLISFLKYLKEKYKPTRVICLGDELDKHAMSFHDSDPDLGSAGDELLRSLPVIKEIEGIFPVMDIIDSNHGSMVHRKAKHHGIPRAYIKSYNEVLGVGPGWKWHNDLVLTLPNGEKVYVHHGKSAEAIKTSQAMSMSHVCGHYHESFGVKYWANPTGLFFAVNAGCLIDDSSYAFAYNNTNLKRPIIGTCLIVDNMPVMEAMKL
jgi:predicted DNA-binding protein YlxM (UPF0122 family)